MNDAVPDEQLESGSLAGRAGDLLADRPRDITKVELPADHAGQLRQAPAEAIAGCPLVALDERVALQGGQETKGGGAVDVEAAGDLGPGPPFALGEEVEDGDRPLDRTNPNVPRGFVAHCATLALPEWALPRKLLSPEHLLGDAQQMSRRT